MTSAAGANGAGSPSALVRADAPGPQNGTALGGRPPLRAGDCSTAVVPAGPISTPPIIREESQEGRMILLLRRGETQVPRPRRPPAATRAAWRRPGIHWFPCAAARSSGSVDCLAGPFRPSRPTLPCSCRPVPRSTSRPIAPANGETVEPSNRSPPPAQDRPRPAVSSYDTNRATSPSAIHLVPPGGVW